MSIQLGFVLFPNLTQLDLTGPLQILSRAPDSEVHLVAESRDLVPTDGVLSIPPTVTFADCPQLDVLLVPGGFGVKEAIANEALVHFVRMQERRAEFVTSVCTGAFVLGAAGLLEGKRATTHWAFHSLLARFGARPERGRVVRDGKFFTGGGVTAGIDFALTLLSELAGEDRAQAVQLAMEYDPEPPFTSGHPDRAPMTARRMVEPIYEAAVKQLELAINEVRAHWEPASSPTTEVRS